MMSYHVTMSNDCTAEATTLAGAMRAAECMYHDAGGGLTVTAVRVVSHRPRRPGWSRKAAEQALWACRVHVYEHRHAVPVPERVAEGAQA